MAYKILCIVPSLPESLRTETVRSILNQTYPIEMLIFLPRKINKRTLNDRIIKVLNDGLSCIHLETFDYLLRIDGDTIIPPNFLGENLKEHADCCGKAGCAMLIKISTFLRLMNGRFSSISDDTYLGLKFMMEGATVIPWKVRAIHESRVAGLDDYLYRGKSLYMVGYEPIHLVVGMLHIKHGTLKDTFTLLTYFNAVIRRMPKSDVAGYVFNRQVKRLLFGKKMS